MEKYEISLWENIWVEPEIEGEKGYYDERKICVIGANDMTTSVRAIEPKFVDNINGTHDFSFKMYKRYIDNTSGESILNPFDKYLTNERKVKVFWKDKWYDFIIKKIQESSFDKSIVYSCEDLFIYELSKNGYELNFDTELKNNIGTSRELIEETIKNSTWKFDPDSEGILQTFNAPVIETESINRFPTINQTIEATRPELDSSFFVESQKRLLVFYDSIIDVFSLENNGSITRDIQLVCDNSNHFITELNSNLVIDNNCLLVKNMVIQKTNEGYVFSKNGVNCFQLPLNFSVSSQYRGERFIDTDEEEYDEDLSRYVVKCYDRNAQGPKNIYRAQVTSNNNPLKVVNLIANPTDFRNTAGWEPAEGNNNKVNVKIYPDDFPSDRMNYSNFNVESTLKIKGKVNNNAFIANAGRFKANSQEEKQGQLSGIQIGDKYTFRYRGFANEIINKEALIIPTKDRTPTESSEAELKTVWEKLPVYIYEGKYSYHNTTDSVGRLVKISAPSLGLTDFTIFEFGTTYKIVSYGMGEIIFGLNAVFSNNNSKVTLSNVEGGHILDSSITLNTSDFVALENGTADGYYFSYNINNGKVDFSELVLNIPEPIYLKRSPQQVFGPVRSNIFYDFMRQLLYKKATSPNSYDSALHFLNARTFTKEEVELFYTDDEVSRYHPDTYDLPADGTAPVDNYRTYVLVDKVKKWGTGQGDVYGPDFIWDNDFGVFCDKNHKGFDLLIDNIAERIYIDPPISKKNRKIYDAVVSSLAKLTVRNNNLKQKIGDGYYYVNGTDKVLDLGENDKTPIEGEAPYQYTNGDYVIYITTINDRIYNQENHSLNWHNYQVGDYIAHLFKCVNNNNQAVVFNHTDTSNWKELTKSDPEFPILASGNWKNNSNEISEAVVSDNYNQYSFHGYCGDYTIHALGPELSNSEKIAFIKQYVHENYGDPPDGLTEVEKVQWLAEKYGQAMSQIDWESETEFSSIFSVYKLGAYISSWEDTSLSGEFDKLLVNTFEPLISHLQILRESLYNSNAFESIIQYSVEEAEINDFVQEEEYDSDFPVLNSYIGNINFGFKLDNDNIFSIEPVIDEIDNWVEYSLVCIKAVPLSRIKDIDFYLNPTDPIWLDNIQLFKNQYVIENGQNKLIYPGELKWENVEVEYLYYEKTDNGIEILYRGPDLQEQYPAVTSHYYKRATINVKQSNRFNILQTIAEAFNGWIYFDIKHDLTGKILLDENNQPEKYVGIQQKKGKEVNIAFEYGIDLKDIQRTIDSDQLTTKIYVLQNSNEFGQNGFCTISRSRQNLTKAPFILDFSYYVQAGLLDEETLNKNLYEWYYPQMNHLYTILDIKNSELISNKEKLTRLQSQLTTYENYAYAAQVEKFSLQQDLQLFTRNFDMSQNNKVKGIRSSIQMAADKVQKYENMAGALQSKVNVLSASIGTLETDVKGLQAQLDDLHTNFNKLYWPFIFEGTWIDEKYINDDSYYLDGLMVAFNSSRPQLTYDINLIRVSELFDFKAKNFHVGDICYVIDRDFFGYLQDGITPFKERVIVNEITSYFDSPEKDSISVKNYRSKFDDLFQKVVAATQSLKFAEGDYTKVAKSITPQRTISYDLLQDTFDYNENLILNSSNQDVTWDETGITITNKDNSADKTRIIAGGIFITNDGGKTWKNAVRGDGISASILTAGRINSGEIYIYDKEYPMFRWDKTGISAYSCIPREQTIEGQTISDYPVNFSKFVRFDKFGIYGYSNPSNEAYLDDFIPETEEEIWLNDYTKFGLTWKGFFLKSTSENGGYVKITTDGDMIKYDNGTLDRKIISSGFGSNETFYLTQNGNAVFSGELRAAKGTFAGDSSTSLLTLDDGGLVFKIFNTDQYEDKFKIKYAVTGEKVYPYLELIGGEESSIIMQNDNNLFIGLKNFVGRDGLTFGFIEKTVLNGNTAETIKEKGVFVDAYYVGTDGTMNNNNSAGHRRTYNLGWALYQIEQRLDINICSKDEILEDYEDIFSI